jgi:hypothetical protein
MYCVNELKAWTVTVGLVNIRARKLTRTNT